MALMAAGAAASLIRFAVVGLGSAGTGRVRVLSTDESKAAGFELKAVVSRRPPPEDVAHLTMSLEDVLTGKLTAYDESVFTLSFLHTKENPSRVQTTS